MSANGDSGKKCLRFYIRLAELISVKKKEKQFNSFVMGKKESNVFLDKFNQFVSVR